MTKRLPKPRTHSTCGHPLDGILLVEVIPAQYYRFTNKEYIEVEMPESIPEILTEWRCQSCLAKIDNGDLDHLKKRIREKNGEE